MNSEQVKGKWNQIKGKMKQEYGIAVDDDASFTEGKYEELLGRAQEKTGKAKEDLKKEDKVLTRYTTCPPTTDSLDHLHLTKTSRQHAVTIVREVRLQLDEHEAFALVRAPHL